MQFSPAVFLALFAGSAVQFPRGYRKPAASGRLRLYIALISTLIPLRLFALDPNVPITDYQRRSWTTQDGYALGEVISLAQTPDGFLWVGTSRGLRRFDGVNYTRWNGQSGGPLDGVRIPALLVAHDGALWIGTPAGVSRLANGKLKSYTTADGLPRGGVGTLLEDHNGVMWIGILGPDGGGLASIDGNTIRQHQQADGLPGATVYSLFEDPNRMLWIGFAGAGACIWHPAIASSCPIPPPAEVRGIAEDATGALVFSDNSSSSLITLGVIDGRVVSSEKKPLDGRPGKLLTDRDGNLWISTIGGGLLRYRQHKVQSLTLRDGLLSNAVDTVLEDHDGNLWVGTPRGLMRLRNPVASRLTVPGSNFPTVLLPADDGSVWIGSINSGLFSLAGKTGSSFSAPFLPGRSIYALHQFGGELWVGARDGLFTLRSGKIDEIRGKEGAGFGVVTSITDDGRGTLWFLDSQGRIFRKTPEASPEPLSYWKGRRARTIFASHDAALWVGFDDGTLEVLRGAGPPIDVLGKNWRPGIVYEITEDGSGSIWVGGGEGLGRFRNGHWTVWGSAEGIPPGGLYTIYVDDSGVWAFTPARLIHISSASLLASPEGVPRPLSVTGYGADEGIELLDNAGVGSPRMALTKDGRFLVPTNTGLAVFDSRRVAASSNVPRTFIDQFLVDGQSLPLTPEPRIRGRQFQFYFTAPNLTHGDATRVYYHLDGVDSDWIESRDDRRAFYGLLRPGDYRFRVRVAGASADASLVFHITPLFYETWYFPVAVLALFGVTAWGLYLLRMKQIKAGMQLVFQERLRVTRELHDSLLQGFTAVVFQLDTAAREFDRAPEDSRARLNKALDQADRSMKEARHAISLLRLPALENQTFSQAIAEVGAQIAEGLGPHFSSHVDPLANGLPYPVQANLYIIARELIGNAATHASASRIDLGLTCRGKSFQLSVEDDGRGFDQVPARPETGHIGLAAVRERASLIGAVLTIVSKPGQGTRCEVSGKVAK